jgi:CheY-like chemotaxis protein
LNVKKNILVIGRHDTILTRIVHLLEENGYSAIGESANDKAIATFQRNVFDAVIIGGGVDKISRDFFHIEFTNLRPNIKIIDTHPSTILKDIQEAFR